MSNQTPNKTNKQRKQHPVRNRENKQVVKQLKQIQPQKEMERLKMAKRGEQKTITIEGIDYLLQHPGLLESIRMRDRSKNEAGSLIEENIYRELMDHVIFTKEGGKTSFDYFEENPGFQEVIREAMTFTFR